MPGEKRVIHNTAFLRRGVAGLGGCVTWIGTNPMQREHRRGEGHTGRGGAFSSH